MGPRCDERALAAWLDFLGYRKSERFRGQAAQEPALLPPTDARCRLRGLARLAVAKTRGRRVLQRLYSVGGVAIGRRVAVLLAAAIAQVASAQ